MKRLFLLLFLLVGSLNSWAAPVDINTADAATIAAALHGIGLKKAQAIVADREKNGAFKTSDDLTRVKGIGAKTVAKNKADILIGGAAAAPVPAPVAATPAPVAVTPAAAPPAPVAAPPVPVVKDAKASPAAPVK